MNGKDITKLRSQIQEKLSELEDLFMQDEGIDYKIDVQSVIDDEYLFSEQSSSDWERSWC